MTPTRENIEEVLRNPRWPHQEDDPFSVLRSIAHFALRDGRDVESQSRELVIRALEARQELPVSLQAMLDQVAVAVGLHPYAEPLSLGTLDRLRYAMHVPAGLDGEDIVLHEAQGRAYWHLINGRSVILSAPTSFGKSLLIDALVASGKYRQILVIVPTIALIDETRRRLGRFREFKLVTQVDQEAADQAIYVMTQERALAYEDIDSLDLLVVDEFYKLSPEGNKADQSRSYLLNQAFYRYNRISKQFYMLGPNISAVPASDELQCVFIRERFQTVVTEVSKIDPSPSPSQAAIDLLLRLKDEATLVYCKSPKSVHELAENLTTAIGKSVVTDEVAEAAEWLGIHYHPGWIVPRALRSGIGIHHGRLPRSIGQLMVRLFNTGQLRHLLCTSTLIEGVNTAAKNVLVYDNRIAQSKLDFFTFNNIIGRSGRMFKHFIGNVFLLADPPPEQLTLVSLPFVEQPDDTPLELLVAMDDADLTDRSSARLRPVKEQRMLPIEVIKSNSGFDALKQIEVARRLRREARSWHSKIRWSGLPSYDQLRDTIEVAWPLHTGRKGHGAFTWKQLTFIISQYRQKGIRGLIAKALGEDKSPTDAVDQSLDFTRYWGSFHGPRLLGAIHSIQESVFKDLGLPPGNYLYFAEQLESGFKDPVAIGLDEYGLPSQITDRLISNIASHSSVDHAIERIRSIDTARLGLSRFEREWLRHSLDIP